MDKNKSFNSIFVVWGVYLPVLFYLCVTIFLFSLKEYRLLVTLLGNGLFLRFGICELIYLFYKKPRPYQKLGINPPHTQLFLSPIEKRYDSFPSAHSTVLFFLAGYLYLNNFLVLGYLAFFVAILAVFSRVKLLYHYWSDIFAGISLAILWLILITRFVKM